MALSPRIPLAGTVDTQAPLALSLSGVTDAVTATIDGAAATAIRHGGVLTITVPAGHHGVVLRPTD
jgi:hypothetical protein